MNEKRLAVKRAAFVLPLKRKDRRPVLPGVKNFSAGFLGRENALRRSYIKEKNDRRCHCPVYEG